MSAQWYYTNNGQQKGPVTDVELKQLAVSGNLIPTDQVWKDGMAAWTNAGNLKGLFQQTPPSMAKGISPPPMPSANNSPQFSNSVSATTEIPIVASKSNFSANKIFDSIKISSSSAVLKGKEVFDKQTPRNKLIILVSTLIIIPASLYLFYVIFLGYHHPYKAAYTYIETSRSAQEKEFAKKYNNPSDIPRLESKNAFDKLKNESDKLLQSITPLPYVVDNSISSTISEIQIGKSTLDSAGFLGWYFEIDIKFKSQKSLEFSTGINVRFMDSQGAMVDENEVHLSASGKTTRAGEMVNATVRLDYSDAPKVVKMIFEQRRK